MLKKSTLSFFLLTCLSLLFAWEGTDASGYKVRIDDTSAILSLGGTVTETIFALGKGSSVLGVDISSLYPAEALAALPKVGYLRQISAEGSLSLRPKLILGTVDMGPPPVVRQLRESGIPVFALPAENSVQGALERIRILASLLNVEKEGKALVESIEADLKAASAFVASRKQANPPKVLFVYARGAGTLMVSGRNTEADTMIKLAGAQNAVQAYEGYRPLTPEAAATSGATVLLFTSLGLESLGGVEGLKKIPALAQTPALKGGKVVHLDDLYLLGFGPRLGSAVLDLAKLLLN